MKSKLLYVLVLLAGLASGYLLFTAGQAAASVGTASGEVLDAAPSSGSAATPAPAPHDQLHDPLSDPAATFDDVKAAKRQGWPLAILAVGVILLRIAERLGLIAKRKTAHTVILGALAIAAAAFDTLVLGGTWMSALYAGVGAFFLATHPGPATATKKG